MRMRKRLSNTCGVHAAFFNLKSGTCTETWLNKATNLGELVLDKYPGSCVRGLVVPTDVECSVV